MTASKKPAPKIVGILLAAGQSTRFGKKNKLLATLSDGTPLSIAAARPLQAALTRVIAVVPAEEKSLQHLLSVRGLELISCPESANGIGASIACGVRASADADGWIIALADMPDISASLIRSIATKINTNAPLVRPFYNNRVGHPVGFSRIFRDELLELHDDTGGQRILKRHASSLHTIPTDNDGIHRDIDTRIHLKNN